MLVSNIMQVLKNLFGLNKKISASEIAFKDINNSIFTLDQYLINMGTYPTEEQRVGTWIDGKPIYRIVKQKYVGTDKAVISLSDINFDNIWLNGNSFIKTDVGICKPLNVFEADNYSIRTEINISEKNVNIWGKSTYYQGTAYVILEYTKTTD